MNAIFSEHYWDFVVGRPFLIMLTKGSVFIYLKSDVVLLLPLVLHYNKGEPHYEQ